MPSKQKRRFRTGGSGLDEAILDKSNTIQEKNQYVCRKKDCDKYLHNTFTKLTCFIDATLSALLFSTVIREHIKEKLVDYMITQIVPQPGLYDLFRSTIPLTDENWFENIKLKLQTYTITTDIDIRRFLLFKLVFFNCFDKNLFEGLSVLSLRRQTINDYERELCRSQYRAYKKAIYGDLFVIKIPLLDYGVSYVNSCKSLEHILPLFGFEKQKDYVIIPASKIDGQRNTSSKTEKPKFIIAMPDEAKNTNLNRFLQCTMVRKIISSEIYYSNEKYILNCGTMFSPAPVKLAKITPIGHFESFAKCDDTYYHLEYYDKYANVLDVVNLFQNEEDKKSLKVVEDNPVHDDEYTDDEEDIDDPKKLKIKRYFSWVIYTPESK
jgi:hypothetical protein